MDSIDPKAPQNIESTKQEQTPLLTEASTNQNLNTNQNQNQNQTTTTTSTSTSTSTTNINTIPKNNLDRFIYYTTPAVRATVRKQTNDSIHLHAAKSEEEVLTKDSQKDTNASLQHSIAQEHDSFLLSDVWCFYDRPYGFEIPLHIDGVEVNTYFVPYLSAMQIFRPSEKETQTNSTPNAEFSTTPSATSPTSSPMKKTYAQIASQPTSLDPKHEASATATATAESHPAPSLQKHSPTLWFEFFETVQPNQRRPLMDQMLFLASNPSNSSNSSQSTNPPSSSTTASMEQTNNTNQEATQSRGDKSATSSLSTSITQTMQSRNSASEAVYTLLHGDSSQIHPDSWFSVLWFPILCHHHTAAYLRGQFLTFHTLSKPSSTLCSQLMFPALEKTITRDHPNLDRLLPIHGDLVAFDLSSPLNPSTQMPASFVWRFLPQLGCFPYDVWPPTWGLSESRAPFDPSIQNMKELWSRLGNPIHPDYNFYAQRSVTYFLTPAQKSQGASNQTKSSASSAKVTLRDTSTHTSAGKQSNQTPQISDHRSGASAPTSSSSNSKTSSTTSKEIPQTTTTSLPVTITTTNSITNTSTSTPLTSQQPHRPEKLSISNQNHSDSNAQTPSGQQSISANPSSAPSQYHSRGPNSNQVNRSAPTAKRPPISANPKAEGVTVTSPSTTQSGPRNQSQQSRSKSYSPQHSQTSTQTKLGASTNSTQTTRNAGLGQNGRQATSGLSQTQGQGTGGNASTSHWGNRRKSDHSLQTPQLQEKPKTESKLGDTL
eukprot:TRINITY_DN8966_c0_g1_i1.p1 TRINITY_DN8966_c0_g1~~TRINITY_DN8966_c0_g1_i1.p1  ORF type:complete len:771 (-),score=172.42 TRINITY_DN8966_c0_g1_i1:259-2571(-)